MIVSREQVRAAYQRYLATNPAGQQVDAIRAVARAMGLAEEAVRDAITAPEQEAQ